MPDDRQSRPTLPPLSPASEDNPPLAKPRRVSRPEAPPEPYARVALRAPKVADDSQEEKLLKALAAVDARAQAFEESVRAELHRVVVQAAPAAPLSPSPTKSIAPPRAAPARDLSWIAQVPAILMAVGALVATMAQSCQKKAEVSADVLAKITQVQNDLTAHVTAHTLDVVNQHALDQKHYIFDVGARCYLKGVLQKQSTKVDDPEDAPTCPDMEFYPAPASGSLSPAIQPKVTFPIPPVP